MRQTAGGTSPKTGRPSSEGSSEALRRQSARLPAYATEESSAREPGYDVPPRRAAGSRPALNCPHCGEPVPLSIWGFNPLTKLVVCQSCSKLSRFPGPARVWGFAALFTVMVVEILLMKDYGPFEPDSMAGVFGKGLLFLFVIFSSMLVGSFVCRKLSAALVP